MPAVATQRDVEVSMIDVLTDELINFRTAAKLPPFRRRDGKAAHISTIFRFAQRGARAKNGDRILLECVKTPSGLRTTSAAVAQFIEQLTNPDLPAASSRQRERSIAAAEKELTDAGVI
jgi:hypothetical protein